MYGGTEAHACVPLGPDRFDEALNMGNELLALYEELGYSSNHCARTAYLLFQLAVTRKVTLKKVNKRSVGGRGRGKG